MYRLATQLGLLSARPAQQLLTRGYFAYKRHFEDPFYNLSVRHPRLFGGGNALDIGANIGYTATVFAGVIDQGFRVWAFEPSADNYSRMTAEIEKRGMVDLIVACRAAVADRSGTAALGINPLHPGDHRVVDTPGRQNSQRVEQVPITTIDEEVESQSIGSVAFIKVDVQGYEMHVCRGMTATIAANPSATIAVEYAPALLREYGVAPSEMMQFFQARGYRAYRVTQRGELVPFNSSLEPDRPSDSWYVDLLFTRRELESDN